MPRVHVALTSEERAAAERAGTEDADAVETAATPAASVQDIDTIAAALSRGASPADGLAALERVRAALASEAERPAPARDLAEGAAPRAAPAPPHTISADPGALDKRPGDPLRFAIGDRVECRVGPRGYVPATVVDHWYENQNFLADVPFVKPEDRLMPYQCELDTGELVCGADHDMCVRAPTSERAAASPAVAVPLGAEVRAPPGARLPPGARPIPRPWEEAGAPSAPRALSQTARNAIARLERGEPESEEESTDDEDAKREWLELCASVSKKPGDSLRFAVGDRVQCKMANGYEPGTVINLWFDVSPDYGHDKPVPYLCHLDDGEEVTAPMDNDMFIRAYTDPAPAPRPPRDHIIRKNEGVSKEVMEKLCSMSCQCSSENCNCSQGPMAMWRSKDGQDQFMGIVRYSSLDIMPDETSVAGSGNQFTLVKLDDPRGELDGPGHVIDDDEFLADVSMYDGCRPIGPKIEFTSMRAKDPSVLRHPNETAGTRYADVTFPFDVRADGTIRPHVRAGDTAKVLLEKVMPVEEAIRLRGLDPAKVTLAPGMPDPVNCTERQWMGIIAVTTCGLVIGYPRPSGPDGDMDSFKWSPEIKAGEPIVFAADCILCMKKGENW